MTNFTKAAWDRTYENNATTNATYALMQVQADPKNCANHQNNAMDCSFSPKLQAWETQKGRSNATKSADSTVAVSAVQQRNCS
jgi:hypothetical protein